MTYLNTCRTDSAVNHKWVKFVFEDSYFRKLLLYKSQMEMYLPGLSAVLRSPELSTAYIIVGKALRRTDILTYALQAASINNASLYP